ncbi:hypothetical protein LTR53_004692 [Teratosphaeriaceae sp. CCFEE 6253]|nr:hypothetical protein LTR53_004692 [Teratosphaeriaceae sp. CCFEE 6253]
MADSDGLESLIDLARNTTDLTFRDLMHARTSELRDTLCKLASDVIGLLIAEDRVVQRPRKYALPNQLEHDICCSITNSREVDATTEEVIAKWVDFAYDVDSDDFAPSACEIMSDNVARVLLLAAWNDVQLLKRQIEEGPLPTVEEVERLDDTQSLPYQALSDADEIGGRHAVDDTAGEYSPAVRLL